MADPLAPARFSRRLAPKAALAATLALGLVTSVTADPSVERVRGFFCNDKSHSVAFLTLQAKGENEEMAANAVNKDLARFSCAYYLPAQAIHTGEQTVIDQGLVFKLQSYRFLPEKVERWSGAVFGSMQGAGASKADI
jgi:hypothetical protein